MATLLKRITFQPPDVDLEVFVAVSVTTAISSLGFRLDFGEGTK